MSTAPHRSWIEVSRRRIAANFQAVRRLVGESVEVMPVVKADAYRHGSVEVSRVLETEGANWLAVSSVEEGVVLRQEGIGTRILVMADFLPSEREALLEYNLTPAMHSLDGLRDLDQMAARRGVTIDYHLKVDTGMARLGASAGVEAIISAIQRSGNTRLEGLMTHFASAALYTSEQTDAQIASFEKLTQGLAQAGIRPSYRHMAATIPVAYGRREAWGNMVRPGHAIYGYVSPVRGNAPARTLTVKPALEWKAAVLETKQVREDTPIGYGGMFRAPRPMRIGILSVGYADGLPHRLSNRGQVIASGRKTPILGAVSMDLTTIDLTAAPDVHVGDAVTLLGAEGDNSIDAQQIARLAGTISYSVLCGISARVKRLYI
ncbi:MAG: alanine racemase [bacterium]|nr:alanine racemase [bacterium]